MLVLALESSTSSAKAMLYDTEQGVVDVRSRSYPAEICAGGVSDTEQVHRLTLEIGAQVARGRAVAAVAVCGTWHSIAVCDGALRPLGATYSWNYMLPSDDCAAMRADKALTHELYTRTGCMPHVTYPRQSLHYLQQNGLKLSDKKLISQGAYTFYRLTGEFCESASTASGSGLLNVHTLQYDEAALGLLGLDPAQLGRLVRYTDVCPLGADAADLLGIAPGVPVVPAHPDGALNQISSCAAQVGRMTLSTGTSAAIRLTADRPVLPEEHQLWCYYGVADWMSGAATSGACNCLNWFLKYCLQNKWSFKELEDPADVGGDVPVFLPFLFGERCPGWRDGRRGGFCDITGAHSVRDLYRAVQAGILFNLYQCFEVLSGLAGAPSDILVSGGILNSVQWTQMLADIFGREIACMPTIDASSMGAVILALHAAGALDDIKQFDGDYKTARRVAPRAAFRDYYAEQYARYLDWYEKTK